MNRTHKQSYFTEERTDLEHQVHIFYYHMSLYVQEGLQRVCLLTHQTIEIKTMAPDT